jgi:hypothetical protein
MQKDKYDNCISLIGLLLYFIKTEMNVNNVNVTLIPSACSKVWMQESEYNPAWTVRGYYSSIYKHGTRPEQNYICTLKCLFTSN